MDVGIKGQLLQYLRQLESSRVLPKKMTPKMIKCCVKITEFTQLCQIPESSACLLHPVFSE